jgi:hypothetical protein
VNQFVEECRREWKRLRVPDLVANEMAADLAADLREAEAEGASAEEVLGSGAFDPRSFAASWAAERGVVPPPLTDQPPRRSLIHPTLAALTVIAAIGAALAFFPSRHDSVAAAPKFVPRLQPMPPAFAVPGNGSGVDVHAVGLILLIVGIVGIILSMLFLFWSSRAGPDHWTRRRRYVDHASGGPGYS